MDLPDNAPCPRLCHIVKTPDFDGYGFNLHADKSRAGQYIGKVDAGSPAEASGLQEYDRIIEVNGVNIANENHKQVVSRIKAIENETRLLVLDTDADKWYKDHNLVVRSDQPNVIHGSSLKTEEEVDSESAPEAPPPMENGNQDAKSVSSESIQSESSTQPQPIDEPEAKTEELPGEPARDTLLPDNDEKEEAHSVSSDPPEEIKPAEIEAPPVPEPHDSDKSDDEEPHKEPVNGNRSPRVSRQNSSASDNSVPVSTTTTEPAEDQTPMSITPSPPPSLDCEKQENGDVKNQENEDKPTDDKSGLNLNMSVAEMKALLASRKKADPRQDTIDFKRKHQIIQNM